MTVDTRHMQWVTGPKPNVDPWSRFQCTPFAAAVGAHSETERAAMPLTCITQSLFALQKGLRACNMPFKSIGTHRALR